jgi:hypothetical protein
MGSDWEPVETESFQDHVIAHTIGATVLGYFEADEALHLILDIGLVWTIYLDTGMALLPFAVAISDLQIEQSIKDDLLRETRLLLDNSLDAAESSRVLQPAVECSISAVAIQKLECRHRVSIVGEESSLTVESSIETSQISLQTVE